MLLIPTFPGGWVSYPIVPLFSIVTPTTNKCLNAYVLLFFVSPPHVIAASFRVGPSFITVVSVGVLVVLIRLRVAVFFGGESMGKWFCMKHVPVSGRCRINSLPRT
jgi:hypothetical protein